MKKTILVFDVILETNIAISINGYQNAYWTLGSVYVGEKHSDKLPKFWLAKSPCCKLHATTL